MEALIAPEFRPFAIAGLIMTGLVAIEILSMIVGFSLSELLGKDIGLDSHHHDHPDHGWVGGALGWVNAGGVPVLVLIIMVLATFSAAGFALQSISSLVWMPLPTTAASLVAAVATIFFTRIATQAVSRIIPRDETYVIQDIDLVGRVAEVTLGPLDQGLAGRVKLKDVHGNWHFPMARAAKDHGPMPIGSMVLLVDREGTAFLAIPAPEELTDR
jgi:hypothetical protein